ncbi:tetratricopeptide repeat protein [Roseomonas sp. CAU 1739]|uniref:O-linked N-acetylglucosamine transferase, SPINDLY family protein n=1 Tax=Roseomonas sp. CAU 1739 TaxID=3140364 RepID=UPI00325AA029
MTAAALIEAAAAHQRGGRAAAAAAAYDAAIAAGADAPELRNNLGVAWRDAGNAARAEAAFRAALAQRPDYVRAAQNLAELLQAATRAAEAAEVFEAAIAAGAGEGLRSAAGRAWSRANRPDLALPHLLAAHTAAPDDAVLRNDLAGVMMALGRPNEAAGHFAAVVAALAHRADVKVNLGVALHQAGRWAEAEAVHRSAIAQDPFCRPAWHNLLLLLNYAPGVTAEAVAREHRAYGEHFPPRAAPPFANRRDPDRRLRIGLLSADFRSHPVGRFLAAPLAALDRRGFEVIAYANQATTDGMTAHLRGLLDGWRPVHHLPDAAAAAAIRADGIDILVDLSGHTQGTRLPVLDHRAAPVQAAWIGYANSTGSAAVDWIIGDAACVPPGEEALYVERVMRLPGCYLCFAPPAFPVSRSPPPMLARGHPVLACFNPPTKLHDGVLAAWARILAALPAARLLLKARPYGEAEAAEAIRARFAACGGDVARLDLEGQSPYPDYFARYAGVDFMLDPFPFPGGTTTAEAIHAGVPTLTLRGRGGMMSRNGETLLSAAGIPDWIAADEGDYIAQAVRRAQDPQGLAAVRARLGLGTLGDRTAYARGLEAAFRAMWRDWCDGRGLTPVPSGP